MMGKIHSSTRKCYDKIYKAEPRKIVKVLVIVLFMEVSLDMYACTCANTIFTKNIKLLHS